jgi:hypothetical protein
VDAMKFTQTTRLRLRPSCEWPPCDGHPRPAVFPELLKILERGTITVFADPIENNGLIKSDTSALPKCDSPLFWAIAEPDLKGWICQHCIDWIVN